jgi:opacity protein-like surface antigen
MINADLSTKQQGRLMKDLLSSHKVLCLAILVSGCAFQAQAKDNPWYVSGALGHVTGSQSAQEIKHKLSGDGIDITDVSIDDSRTGWLLNLGYEVKDNISIELGYLDLNDADITIEADVTDPEAFIENIKDVHPSSAKGITVSGLYHYHLNDDLSLSTKLGLYNWRGDFKTNSQLNIKQINTKTSSTDIHYSINADYKLTKKLSLFIEWSHYKLEGEGIKMWALGGKFRF